MVVLSSNDGCVVARSNEAKALGIPMAAPAFKYRQVFKEQGVIQFSANFSLYADISRRIIEILTTITPRTEVYSVDESFLDLSELPIDDYMVWGSIVRQRILDWVGIPVSIGIAPTKTLAKLASEVAKKEPSNKGVLVITNTNRETLLSISNISNVWGVGWRLAPKLRSEGIQSALDLAHTRPQLARSLMGVHGTQLTSELNGISCHPLEPIGKPCKSIARTRTFGEDTNNYYAIEAAIATFTAQASFRLRESRQLARRASIFLTNNKHKPGHRYWSREITLQTPTADTAILIGLLVQRLKDMFSKSVFYHRAGINLYDFISDTSLQLDLFKRTNPDKVNESASRMKAFDSINQRYGKRHVRFAAEQLGNTWKPKYKLRSPRYTTHWDELPTLMVHKQV